MKLVTYRKNKTSEARLGIIHNKKIVDAHKLGLISGFEFPDSMLKLIDQVPFGVITKSRQPSSTL